MKPQILSSTFLAFTWIVFGACNTINSDDLVIVDGVKLGTNLDNFNQQLITMSIKADTFYTKDVFYDTQELNATNTINAFRSDIFNSSTYQSENTDHYGIYFPTTWNGTNNVIGLSILLGHTDNAMGFFKSGVINITKRTKISSFIQDLSNAHIEEIAGMLSSKYGKPDTIRSYLTNFYVIEGAIVRNYKGDSSNVGDQLIWKSKYLDVRLFKGIRSQKSTFDKNKNTYSTTLEGLLEYLPTSATDIPCSSYSYISYQLHNETIKKLKLDQTKL